MESTRHQAGRGARLGYFWAGGQQAPAGPNNGYDTLMPADLVEGVVAVIEVNGRMLAIRRAPRIPAGGWWCLPGGAIEPGETIEQALVREVREEVGLNVFPVREVWQWLRPDGRLHLHWWLARLTDDCAEPQPNAGEVSDVRWVSPEEFRRLEPVLESNLAFLDHYPETEIEPR